jgi:hypothetical protein
MHDDIIAVCDEAQTDLIGNTVDEIVTYVGAIGDRHNASDAEWCFS